MSINFEQITKHYNAAPVVNDVSLQIEAGEFFEFVLEIAQHP